MVKVTFQDITLGKSRCRLCIPSLDAEFGGEIFVFKTPYHADYKAGGAVCPCLSGRDDRCRTEIDRVRDRRTEAIRRRGREGGPEAVSS